MIAIKGTYENGVIRLDKKMQAKKPVKVIVTFLDEEVQNDSRRLSLNDFSFQRARDKSKRFKGSLSDAVIEDRKNEI
jgi:hypothetical protein